ncbi:MFS general substrate transporter [Aulographum hederae CBS 113979]|uniref:MFS general substrate transporter n=1 Tax=Aulographum hederae CBS 113979 TaxID=1176131 RepID=A0A6G1GKW7_9PEZI|nr:MFS general substrate transporter [Aulographum hederae CBS 113979]
MASLRAQWRDSKAQSQETSPFPTRQLFVLALCRICEPIAFMSIFPYIYYMVKSFKLTDDETQLAVYAGMVTSAFAFAEFAAGVFWGRLSDKVGRKPILLMGMAGTGLSMLMFGFSRNLTTALIARALGGLLNGNIGVLQTTVAEVVTVEAHKARGFSIMPFVWCLGSIIGSGLGGTLAEPVKNYPSAFAPGSIWEQYPYLLPNVVCTVVVVVGVVIGVLFLEETHYGKKNQRDRGVELGHWLLQKTCNWKTTSSVDAKVGYFEETLAFLAEDEQPVQYHSTRSSPSLDAVTVPSARLGFHRALPDLNALDSSERLPASSTHDVEFRRSVESADTLREDNPCSRSMSPLSTAVDSSSNSFDLPDLPLPSKESQFLDPEEKTSLKEAFSPQVILNIVGYGILAFHTISMEQLLPVLFSMPESHEAPESAFKFSGGFQMSTKSIGVILSIQGFMQMIIQIFLFPLINKRFGNLITFRVTVMAYPFLYFLIPYLALLPGSLRMPAVYLVLLWKVTAQSSSYPSLGMMLANMAPSTTVLGTLNGAAASSASLCRAIGPTTSGLIQSAGSDLGYSGLAWWACSVIAVLGAAESIFMKEQRSKASTGRDSGETSEAGLFDPLLEESAHDRGSSTQARAERTRRV